MAPKSASAQCEMSINVPCCNLCRKSKEREAIFAADDGAAPPLSQRGPALPWGHLGGSEALMPPGLRQVRLTLTSTIQRCIHVC